MKRMLNPPCFVTLMLLLAGAIRSRGQGVPRSPYPELLNLAREVGGQIQQAKTKKIFVADLCGPNGERHPIGKWLADQLSVLIAAEFPDLEVMQRSGTNAMNDSEEHAFDHLHPTEFKEEAESAAKLGANAVVAGSFALLPQGLGVTLHTKECSGGHQPIGEANGLIPVSSEITAVSTDPIPSSRQSPPIAGVGGVSNPDCVECEPPRYTDKARKAKVVGVVSMWVTLAADGRVLEVTVVSSPGHGLDAVSVDAVKKWKLRPARGPDGNPTACVVPVDTTFQLY
jgi:TonB family protein